MTPNHDHASLFVAPPSPAEAVGRPQSAVDRGAEAMRWLRHPFAAPGAPAPGPARWTAELRWSAAERYVVLLREEGYAGPPTPRRP